MSRWTKRRSHVRSREITQHERTGQAHHAIVPDVLHRHLAPSAATRVTPAAQDATMSLRATSTGAVDCGGVSYQPIRRRSHVVTCAASPVRLARGLPRRAN
ncbi:hypothetical protein P8C59_001052 [Phyllachora maydis]|uniref:Uncharacterized protein n=1 Tax=Phyllachora maydis TaxID=1825666 RepID=A0AAD9HYW9_9PEZI|nr:hypothetical protein P8C59_001052 [Phyllachora maydis]